MEDSKKIDRRNFLKTMGAAGLGAAFISGNVSADPNEPNTPPKPQEPKYPRVPRRKLGKTGIDVPCLSLGLMFDVTDKQIVLGNALKYGINYWDTAHSYAGGNSEIGIGKYISSHPSTRKNLFIVTKATGARTAEDIEKRLQTSLERMNTKYIDLYYHHGLESPSGLSPELQQWAKNAKQRKLIRFFGFSTHKNMAQCLEAAAKLDWIDVIMTSYNFRLMQDAQLQAAVDSCYKAGIGLVAMKILAKGSVAAWAGQATNIETEQDKKVVSSFLEKGFTKEQAQIKAVLADERFCSACVSMQNTALLTSNVAAALDKTKLTQADMAVFKEYAQATCDGYCAGCADICDSALPGMPYVSDIMRYLMYYNSYGDKNRARELFAQIPNDIRGKLLSADYSLAEVRCPQHMPISRLVAEAVSKLA
jgi:hypothetical protein